MNKKLLKYFFVTAIILGLSMSNHQSHQIQKLIDKTVDNKSIFGISIAIASADSSFNETYSSGNLNDETQYFIASTTKLFTSSLIFQLREKGKLNLDDLIAEYLPANVMDGLHVFKGEDYSNQITIRHLLSQTSGLPDYFQGKRKNEKSLEKIVTRGNDQAWTFEEALAIAKNMKPGFKPGQKGKALYSDTNYQLLAKIIEKILGISLAKAYQLHIIQPLKLSKTYLYQDTSDTRPIDIYNKGEKLNIPKTMSSFGADGGIVSTSKESLKFVRAFFDGSLFPKEYLNEMQDWNRIFFPLQYGMGMMRFSLPGIMSGGQSSEFLGHSGLSGAFAYYVPEKDVYIAGTVNQIDEPGASFQLLIKLINELEF